MADEQATPSDQPAAAPGDGSTRAARFATAVGIALLLAVAVVFAFALLSDTRFEASVVLSERGDATVRRICGPASDLGRDRGSFKAEVVEGTLADDYVELRVEEPACAKGLTDLRVSRGDLLAVAER